MPVTENLSAPYKSLATLSYDRFHGKSLVTIIGGKPLTDFYYLQSPNALNLF